MYLLANKTHDEKKASILIGTHFKSFIQHKVGSGRYNSVSKVIRAGLRILLQEDRKIDALKEILNVGENSGITNDFIAQKQLRGLHEKHFYYNAVL